MRRPLSVRVYLTALSLGIVLPLIIFFGVVAAGVAEREQTALTTSVRYRTRIAAAAIDTELFSLRSRMLLLAGSINMPISDLRDIQARAARLFEGLTLVLSDPDGHALFNTVLPYGSPLPDVGDSATIRRVAATQQPAIGDLTTDPLTGVAQLMIDVPVTGTSGPVLVLSLNVAPLLSRFLDQRDLPAGWVAAILDREGRIIGRSHRPEQYLGQLAHPKFIQRIRAQTEGWNEGRSREGIHMFAAFARTSLGGWTIVVAMPRDILMEPAVELLGWLGLLGVFSLALALGLAVLIGRRLTTAVTGLVPVADAVGRGAPAPVFASGLVEANLVARSLHDASERLLRTDNERRALVGRTVIAQEEERKRIARELHDSLAQYLTALGLAAEKLRFTPDVADQGVIADELRRSIRALGRELTRLTWELRPVALEGLTMHDAISLYLEEWAERAAVLVDVEIDLANRNLPREIEATLFRVLQEATNNVLRHAGATRLAVILESRKTEVRLLVEDDGKGFVPPEGPQDGMPGGHLGLIGMRERLALVHGSLEVESALDAGTTLYIRIPLEEEAAPS